MECGKYPKYPSMRFPWKFLGLSNHYPKVKNLDSVWIV